VGSGSFATTKLGALTGSGLVDNSGTPVVLSLGATSTGVFTGIIQNSVAGGSVSLWRNAASGTQYLTGLNTYTGATVISGGGGTLAVNSLANGGVASAIGMSSNAASNLVFNNGVLQYTGSNASFVQFTQTPSVSIDRLFTLAGNATIDSSGQFGNNNLATGVANNAALVFANTGTIAFGGTGNRTLTLQGNSTGDNEIALKLVDNTTGGGTLFVTKTGGGQWLLTGTNTYSGTTTVSQGVLQAQDGVGLPTTSNLTLNGGVFQSNGTFSRTLGTGAGQVQFGSGNGGFAASGTHLNVNLGATVTMGTGAFAGSTLILNAANAPGDVDFQSGLNLGTAARTIQVDDNTNTGMDFATISGIISGGSAGITSLTKSNTGNLILSAANTYTGTTAVTAGALFVQSIGAAGATSSSVGSNTGGWLTLGSGGTGAALLYVGPGEVTTRTVGLNVSTGGDTIDSSGSGALVLTSVVNMQAGAKTLTLRGLNTDNNMITSQLTDGGTAGSLGVTKSDGGVWVLAPSTGNNTFTGAIAANGGLLGLSQAGLGSAASVSIGGGGIYAVGGSLTIGVNVSLANNNQFNSFAGSNPITVTGTITGGSGNPWYLINSMDNGALLTLGNFVAANETTSRTLNIRGYGSTAFTGTISNNSTNQTSVDIRVANNAAVTMGSISGFSGGLSLYQGILVANNPNVVAGTSVLGAAGALFNFGGGELRSNYAMTGANAFQNPVTLAGDAAVVSGTSSIEFNGIVTNGASGRIFQNDLFGANSFTLSGSLNSTQTTVFQGAGNTVISGTWSNVGPLTYQGTGTLSLTGTNTATGALTVNRGLVVLSGTGTLLGISGVTLLAGGTLRLDDTSGVPGSGRLGAGTVITSSGGLIDLAGNSGTLQFGSLTVNTTGTYLKMANAGTVTFAGITFGNSGLSLDLTSLGSLGVSGGQNVLLGGSGGLTFSNGLVTRVAIGGDFATYDGTLGFTAFTGYNAGALDSLSITDTGSVSGNDTLSRSRTINALKLNAASISGSQALTLSSGGLLANGGSSTISLLQLMTSSTNSLFVQVSPNSTLTLNASISTTSAQALSKLQAGTLILGSQNFIGFSTNLIGGSLVLNGGLNTLQPGQNITFAQGTTLDLAGNAQYVASVVSGGTISGTGGNIISSVGSGLLVSNPTSTNPFAGVLSGSLSFGMVGATATILESAQAYTGVTLRSGATLTLRDDASILNTSSIELNSGGLTLDNNASMQIQNNNRISDTAPITLRSGAITLTGRAKAAATETLGAVTAAMGANTITANATPGTGTFYNSAELTLARLTRNAGATVNFTGAT